MGTGVLDPPFFATKMARLNRYLRAKEDEDEEEQPRFLILFWFSHSSFTEPSMWREDMAEAKLRPKFRDLISKIGEIFYAIQTSEEGLAVAYNFLASNSAKKSGS